VRKEETAAATADVVAGPRVPLVSASEITLYRECKRKWGWRYVERIKPPQNKFAALGQEVEETQLQPYLRDGRPFDFSRESGYIAASGLAYLPEPKAPGLEVQKHFVMPPMHGVCFGYQGVIDLWLPDSALAPGLPGGAPLIADFKTTSNLKWAKNEKALSQDVQAMTYAMHAISTHAKVVDLSWIYLQTRGARKSLRTYIRVNAEHVTEQFGRIHETALEMQRVRAESPRPSDMPPSPDMCEAYGGCPYRDRCHLSSTQIIDAFAAGEDRLARAQGLDMNSPTATNPTIDLLALTKARKAAAAGVAATPPIPLAPVAPTPPPLPAPAVVTPAATINPAALTPEIEAWIRQNPRAAVLFGVTPQGAIPAPAATSMMPINPPESALPAPAANVTPAETTKRRGRPPKAAGAPMPAEAADNLTGKMELLARALRDAADAVLEAITPF